MNSISFYRFSARVVFALRAASVVKEDGPKFIAPAGQEAAKLARVVSMYSILISNSFYVMLPFSLELTPLGRIRVCGILSLACSLTRGMIP